METLKGTLVTDAESGRPVLRRIRVRVVEGTDAGQERILEVGTLIVGTSKDAGVVLTDPLVSRRHCEVQLVADGVRVRDLGSKNGTLYGAVRIEQAVLAPGARVHVGDTVLALEALDAPADLGSDVEKLGAMQTRVPRVRELFALLTRAAKSEATILLEGETGVGKDLFARTIHGLSGRASAPLVVFDCASVSPTLIAGELFGHKKGAFTGATSDRPGVFEEAKGGTVFLDEIGELTLDLQPSLLRVLESRQVRRVGENTVRDIDVRVIAATNRSLKSEVEAGRFRRDLYFRLAIVRATIPALRERLADVPLIANAILEELGTPGALSQKDVERLLLYRWPGNVRELRNLLLRSAALSEGGFALLPPGEGDDDDLPPLPATVRAVAKDGVQEGVYALPYKEARHEAIEGFERKYIVQLLKAQSGNVSAAARAAGIDRKYLHRLIAKYAIEKSEVEG